MRLDAGMAYGWLAGMITADADLLMHGPRPIGHNSVSGAGLDPKLALPRRFSV